MSIDRSALIALGLAALFSSACGDKAKLVSCAVFRAGNVECPSVSARESWASEMEAGNRAHENGDYDRAETHYRRALAVVPLSFESHQRASTTYNNLALAYRRQSRYEDAVKAYERSLEEWNKSGEPDNAYVARVLEDYANLLRLLEREKEASEMEARAAGIKR